MDKNALIGVSPITGRKKFGTPILFFKRKQEGGS